MCSAFFAHANPLVKSNLILGYEDVVVESVCVASLDRSVSLTCGRRTSSMIPEYVNDIIPFLVRRVFHRLLIEAIHRFNSQQNASE